MATGTELARAYVTLIPSMQGSQRQIERDLGNVDTARVGRQIGTGMGTHIGSSLKSLIGPAIALAGAVGVGKFVTDSVKALSRIETINTQTATAIKSTGNSANVTAKEIEDLAGQLENMTATEAESIQEGANLLLTFKNIKNGAGEGNDIFNQTTMAMTDMARAMGTDAKGGAIQLGKALNDPTKGIAALTRVGITFSDEQKNMIASLQESGDIMGAQKIILAELQSQFGGSAAAYADTFQGRIDLLGHALGTFGEAVSVVVLPAVKALAIAGADALNWAAELFTTDEYVAWGEGVGAALTGATEAASGVFSAFRDGLAQTDEGAANSGIALWAENVGYSISEARAEVTGGLMAMTAAFKAGDGDITSSGFAGFLETIGAVAREVWDVLAPAFEAIGPQALQLLTTLSPLGIIFKALQPVLPQLGEAIGALATAIGGVLAAILPTVTKLITTLVGALSGSLATILPVIAELLTTVGTVLADTLIALLPVIVPLIELVANAMVTLMPVIAQLVAFIGGALGDVLVQVMPIIVSLAGVLGTVLGAALNIVVTILPILVSVAMQLLTALMPLIPAILQVVTALLPLIPVMLQLVTALLPVWIQLMNLLIPILVWLVDVLVAFLVPVITKLSEALVWLVSKITDGVAWFTNLAASGTSLKDTLAGVWTSIKNAASSAWTWLKDNVFSPFKTGVDAIGTAFGSLSDTVGTAWDAIQDAATGPVNFIIETVYTNGIKKLFDTVAEKLGLDLRLPTVNKINTAPVAAYAPGSSRPTGKGQFAFAAGGVLPGYTPGRDVHEFYSATAGRLSLSGGEAIMRPEFTKAVGGVAGVARLNQMAIKGQAFAGGGVWGWVKDRLGEGWDFTKNAAKAVGNFMKDPVKGALEVISKPVEALFSQIGGGDIGQMLTGIPKKLLDGIVNAAKSIFGEPRVEESVEGAGGSVGGFNGMGYRAQMAALQNLIPGARVTSSYRAGDPNMHGKGRAIDIGNPTMARFNTLLSAFPNAYQLLYSPANDRQITWAGKRGNTSGALRADHYDHIHWAMAKGGVWPGAQVYDQGGWLPPGGVAVNLSNRPEPVFTGEQFDKMSNGSGPVVENLNVTASDPEAAARAVMRRLEDTVLLNDLASIAKGF